MNNTFPLFEKIDATISSIKRVTISQERKVILQSLIDFIQDKIKTKQAIQINFICTHNSRRSHLAQIWTQAIGHYFNITNLRSYSGGTEATTLYPKIAETLENQGFKIEKSTDAINPKYKISYAKNMPNMEVFSKKFDCDFNPKSNFAAIMTCTEADKGCPIVVGAEKRIPITYEDPKIFDNTPLQRQKYKERSLQIATEIYYVFSKIKFKNGQ